METPNFVPHFINRFWNELTDDERQETLKDPVLQTSTDDYRSLLETLLLHPEGLVEIGAKDPHFYKRIPEWRYFCWETLRTKCWDEADAERFTNAVTKTGSMSLIREMIYVLTVRVDYSREYSHHHKIILDFIQNKQASDYEKQAALGSRLSRVPRRKELLLKIVRSEADFISRYTAVQALADTNQYWLDAEAVEEIRSFRREYREIAFSTTAWFESSDDLLASLEALRSSRLPEYFKFPLRWVGTGNILNTLSANLRQNADAAGHLIDMLQEVDARDLRQHVLSNLALHFNRNGNVKHHLEDLLREPQKNENENHILWGLIAYHEDPKFLSKIVVFWANLEIKEFTSAIDIFLGNFDTEIFRTRNRFLPSTPFDLINGYVKSVVLKNRVVQSVFACDEFWRVVRNRLQRETDRESADKLRRKLRRYLLIFEKAPAETFGHYEFTYSGLAIPISALKHAIDFFEHVVDDELFVARLLTDLSNRQDLNTIISPPDLNGLDLKTKEHRTLVIDWLNRLKTFPLIAPSPADRQNISQRASSLLADLDLDDTLEKQPEALVDRLLTTHDVSKPDKERREIITRIAEGIAEGPHLRKVTDLLERYLVTKGSWAFLEQNECYQSVYQAAYDRRDPRFVESDFGDYGEPLRAFGPEANAWQALLQKLWTKEQALDFVAAYVANPAKDEYQLSVARAVIEVCEIYPNDDALAKALIEFAERENNRRLVVYLSQFYFGNCKCIVPFLKDHLSSDDKYARKEAFRALCSNLNNSPEEWDFLVERFKSCRTATHVKNRGYYFVGKLFETASFEFLIQNSFESGKIRDVVLFVLAADDFEKSQLGRLLRKYEDKFNDTDKAIITKHWPEGL